MNVTQIQGAAGGSLTLHTQVLVSLTELQMSTHIQIPFLTTATLGQEGRGALNNECLVMAEDTSKDRTDRRMDGGSKMHPEVERYRLR